MYKKFNIQVKCVSADMNNIIGREGWRLFTTDDKKFYFWDIEEQEWAAEVGGGRAGTQVLFGTPQQPLKAVSGIGDEVNNLLIYVRTPGPDGNDYQVEFDGRSGVNDRPITLSLNEETKILTILFATDGDGLSQNANSYQAIIDAINNDEVIGSTFGALMSQGDSEEFCNIGNFILGPFYFEGGQVGTVAANGSLLYDYQNLYISTTNSTVDEFNWKKIPMQEINPEQDF